MTLEERIARAIHDAKGYCLGCVAEPAPHDNDRDLARAVVAVLPTADVSDEAIMEAAEHTFTHDHPAAVRALLDAQAAAHAAEVEALRAENERLTNDLDAEETSHEENYAEVEALRAEVKRLRKLENDRHPARRGHICTTHWFREHEDENMGDELCRKCQAARAAAAEADRDRAVAEALERAANVLGSQYGLTSASEVVRSLIPNGDEA